MIRALSILAAIAALAVSTAPIASAGSKAEGWAGVGAEAWRGVGSVSKPKHGAIVYNGHAGLGANAKAIARQR